MRFSKYHGCKNDFIVVVDQVLSPAEARALCDRHTGVGADGVALVSAGRADEPPAMRIINADGSVPEMCGNALRCVVKHLMDRGLAPDRGSVDVATDAGTLRAVYARDARGRVSEVTVDMGPPRTPVEPRAMQTAAGRLLSGYTVSMGNPHFVTQSDRPMHDAQELGAEASTHGDFPEGINASFVRIRDPRHAEAVVFERGAGLTQACGTGACAIAAVGWHLGLLDPLQVEVQLPGGALFISRSDAGHLMMRGPATWVFDGET